VPTILHGAWEGGHAPLCPPYICRRRTAIFQIEPLLIRWWDNDEAVDFDFARAAGGNAVCRFSFSVADLLDWARQD
jgi:hypothetical protein